MKKLSTNLKQEFKRHLFWLATVVPAAILVAFALSIPMFDRYPLWVKVALGLVCLALHYAWWRHCLSPDKKIFTPKWW